MSYKIFNEVMGERIIQEELCRMGKIPWTCAGNSSNPEKLVVLAEEFGEVSKEVCEQLNGKYDPFNLRAELIQVAAVCVAWIEALDEEEATPCQS